VALMGRVPHHPQIEKHYTRPPEWRMNPATGEWVIVAPERSARPMLNEAPAASRSRPEACPFCAGREQRTPPELGAIRPPGSLPNSPDWRVRCVPNAFAAVKNQSAAHERGDGFYREADAVGRHELFVECPQHEASLAALSVEQFRLVIQLWRERMLDAGGDPALKYAQLFKNHGPEAGASVEHAHSQLIALPRVPRAVAAELSFAARFYEERGDCVYCELLRRERADGSRVVIDSNHFSVLSAYAARQPFELCLVPKAHQSQFELISLAEIDDLGTVLRTILRKMDAALENPSFNLVFHTGPLDGGSLAHYHWHIEILPRLSQLAGFEWGTGAYVSPVLPEDAALVLKEAAG
jgi:UDPglucose--hexose-1-phosphate uridylyltransferase